MAQNVIINGVTYSNVPEVDIPKSGSGTAKFYDTSAADISAGDVLTGKTAFGASGSVSGNMANNGSTSGSISTKNGTVSVPADSEEAVVVEAAKTLDKVAKSLEGMKVVKTILVKNRLVNLIVKPQ